MPLRLSRRHFGVKMPFGAQRASITTLADSDDVTRATCTAFNSTLGRFLRNDAPLRALSIFNDVGDGRASITSAVGAMRAKARKFMMRVDASFDFIYEKRRFDDYASRCAAALEADWRFSRRAG